MNQCTFAGHLGADPEGRKINGTPKVGFSLAIRVYQGKDKAAKAVWIRCEAWGQLAVAIHRGLKKGSKVVVSGEIDHAEYETDAGSRREYHYLRIRDAQWWAEKGADSAKTRADKPGRSERVESFDDGADHGADDDIPF